MCVSIPVWDVVCTIQFGINQYESIGVFVHLLCVPKVLNTLKSQAQTEKNTPTV